GATRWRTAEGLLRAGRRSPPASSCDGREHEETTMTTTRAVVLALLCSAVPAWALVPGGGSARSDCYVEWQVTGPDVVANRGKTGIDCQDGDPACDIDGAQ